ncbi:MAG: aminotransferase class I/II-fold pyridoxal phosphate-dependent enzyme [Chloroflexia bacterium]|nr:aminotransferase class I/II-fold pyridoxal phosphate-dependent enzyme [Chloroflexia bacterium]
MTEHAFETSARAAVASERRWRLDLIPNPYGPVDSVIDAVSRFDGWSTPSGDQAETLRVRLAARAGVSSDWIVLANGIDELHAMIAQWRSHQGPTVVFPPSDPMLEAWLGRHSAQVEPVWRGPGFALPIEAGTRGLPRGATSVVLTPNDPTGTIVSVQEAVRLSRQSALVVIDERHAAYSPRTLAPLVREFDNLVLLQTFETFAALTAFPLAWAVAPPKIAREIAAQGRPSGLAQVSVVAALAALEAETEIKATVRRVMIEKGRLFRQLRKLNMISPPYPSWSNFLLARIERGTSAYFIPRLRERGITVFEVESPKLPNHLRISGVSQDATTALKQALIEIALNL